MGMRRIGPEVHEQQASTFGNVLTGAPEQLQIMLRREQMHHLRDKDDIVTRGNGVLEKVSLHHLHLPFERGLA